MSTASAYSLADQVRAKRKYAEDQGPPKRDPALDVALWRGLGRVLYQSCVAVLGCLATLSENFLHKTRCVRKVSTRCGCKYMYRNIFLLF